MMDDLNKLKSSEKDMLFKGPLYVNILIAGADGKIDKKERKAAFDYVHNRGDKMGNPIEKFFHHLTENLNLYYTEIIQSLPRDFENRNKELVKILGKYSSLFLSINREFAIEYYQSLREIAQQTATASGGLLGMGSISSSEQKYLLLPMIIDPEVQDNVREQVKKEVE